MRFVFILKSKNLSVLLAMLTVSCIDAYWPDVLPKYQDVLVVDGSISNQPGPYTIRISRSSDLNNPIYRPLKGCIVEIEEQNGIIELLTETDDGIYKTNENGILGKCGYKYKITITAPDGNRYQSDFEEMPLSTGIDTIYTAIEYRPHPYFTYRNITGLRFYVDTYAAEVDTNYFLWKLEATYQFNANYRIRYYFDGQMHPFSPTDSLYTCYKTVKIPEIYTYSTELLSVPKVTKFPLNFVTTETKELSIRYSLLVSQYSISKRTFDFWNQINTIETEQSELHVKQPFQVRGNVYNVADNNEPVLGCFLVGGLEEKRIFVDRPSGVEWYYQDSCNLYPVDMDVLWIHYNEWPLYLPAFLGESGGYSPAWVDYQWCVDCTAKGAEGYLKKPDFWVD